MNCIYHICYDDASLMFKANFKQMLEINFKQQVFPSSFVYNFNANRSLAFLEAFAFTYFIQTNNQRLLLQANAYYHVYGSIYVYYS